MLMFKFLEFPSRCLVTQFFVAFEEKEPILDHKNERETMTTMNLAWGLGILPLGETKQFVQIVVDTEISRESIPLFVTSSIGEKFIFQYRSRLCL